MKQVWGRITASFAVAALTVQPLAAADRLEPGKQGESIVADQPGTVLAVPYSKGVRVVGHNAIEGRTGNLIMAWSGRCAYVAGGMGFGPNGAPMAIPHGPTSGVAVIDVSNPKAPKLVRYLQDKGALDAAETMHAVTVPGRAVLAASTYGGVPGMGGPKEGWLDIYDVADCARPKLMAEVLWPEPAHTVTVSPDGKRVYGTIISPFTGGGGIQVMDISDLTKPRFVGKFAATRPDGSSFEFAAHQLRLSADERRIYVGVIASKGGDLNAGIKLMPPNAKGLGPQAGGVYVLDNSDLVEGKVEPKMRLVGTAQRAGWHSPALARIGGKPYVVNAGELGACPGAWPKITDLSDEANPRVVGEFRLAMNREENCPAPGPIAKASMGISGDPGTASTHFNDVDSETETRLGLFSFMYAGVRLVDLRDPTKPVEVGYFKPGDVCASHVRYDESTGNIWFACVSSGFHVIALEPKLRARLGYPKREEAMTIRSGIVGGLLLASAALGASAAPAASALSGDACAGLAALKLRDVEIVSATNLAEGAAVPDAGLLPMFGKAAVVGKAPAAICRVVGRIRPTRSSDIGFEVWLPASGWNGRMHGIGIGGFAGVIDYFNLGVAIRGGQVGVATDTGHRGSMQDYAWAKDQPEQVRDYSWRGVHLSTVAAKKLVAAFYGRGPDKSYFVGCSGGGRQGLVEAARFPEDYDGVLAGAPAANFTTLAMALTNSVQAQSAPGAAIKPAQAKFLQAEVLKQCDSGDGQVDGLVAEPRQCRFDASKLSCANSDSPQCFSDQQIDALKRIQAGPRTAAGSQLAGGYLPSGSEAGDPSPLLGWEGYLLRGGPSKPGGEGLAEGMLGALIQQPFATPLTFDWERHPAMLRAASRELDAPLDLGRFFARGGKLLIWHGWADAAIPPEHALDYYDGMLRRSGPKAAASARLFMVPGVQHCFGGLGPDVFGQAGAPAPGDTPERHMVRALQDWREGQRAAPETFVGRRGHGGGMFGAAPSGPERQRRLCAWPKREVLRPGGDPDKDDSYSCEGK